MTSFAVAGPFDSGDWTSERRYVNRNPSGFGDRASRLEVKEDFGATEDYGALRDDEYGRISDDIRGFAERPSRD
jgi:hypothetical protein